MVLLVLGILALLILIFKRKKKTGKKSEGNSKNKNWILIGCLSIVIPIAILTVSSPILSLMDMWGLFAHVSRTEIEQAVHRSYQNYGLTGQFELEKYEKNYTSVGGFIIHGTYSENIAGKTYEVKTRFKYYTRFSENKTYGKTDAEVDYKNDKKIYNVFPELAYLGIEVSPGTNEFLKTLDSSIKDPKLSDLKYEGIRFEFNSQSDNIYLYNERSLQMYVINKRRIIADDFVRAAKTYLLSLGIESSFTVSEDEKSIILDDGTEMNLETEVI